MTLDLSVVIPTKNESKNLPGCLEALGRDFAAHVYVIDSSSTDNTTAIAAEWGAQVLPFDWDGRFPKKRNWFLRNHPPSTAWVLFLDADEYLTDSFKKELRAVLPASNDNGYWLNYTVHFLGAELRHGYPLQKLALFRVGEGEYERIDEDEWSALDMEIHEHPIINGSVSRIRSKIVHHDYRGIYHYIAKHNEYSSWEANRYVNRFEGKISRQLTRFQRIKYAIMGSPFAGVVYFFGAYVLMGGFLDGKRGFLFALLKMSYFTQVYCKVFELNSGLIHSDSAQK
jgi:glycosyltransferase involved in cell wall biosynthesis